MARKKLRVALIFGGTSKEREVSIESAKVVAANLDPNKYLIVPVEISESGKWLVESPAVQLVSKGLKVAKVTTCGLVPLEEDEKPEVDLAFLALHGPGGEDGTIQGMLDLLKIPYTCSGVLASALAMDKAKTKRLVASEGVLVAPHVIIKRSEYLKNRRKFLSKLRGKIVIKPNRIGSSIGVTITDKKDEIKTGIEDAFKHDDEIMVEGFVAGRELTVPVLGNRKPQAFPVIEILPKKDSKFFDFRAKYNPDYSDEIVPAMIPKNLAKQLQEQALLVHKLLDCRGVTRSDFIVTPKGQIYFLEINTIPGLTSNSLTPKSAKAAGISYSKYLDKLIDLALGKEN